MADELEATGGPDGPRVIDALRRGPGAAVDALTDRLLESPAGPVRPVDANSRRWHNGIRQRTAQISTMWLADGGPSSAWEYVGG